MTVPPNPKVQLVGDYVPNGFIRQFKFPFVWKP